MPTFVSKSIAAMVLWAMFSGSSSQLTGQITYSITDLGVASGRTGSNATGLNDNGQVVGSLGGGGIGGSVGFVWDAVNGMVALEGFRTTNDSNQAYGINNMGQIIGVSYRDAGEEHAILWEADGTKVDLGDLPGGNDNSFGRAINNAGQATGLGIASSGRRAFLWDSVNGITDPVGDFPGGTDESFGRGINDVGQVVGYSNAATGARAFLWDGLINLGDLPGGDDVSVAQGLNNLGQVVGYSESDEGRRAFIWDEFNGMIELGFAINSMEQNAANDINDAGFVVGTLLGNQGTFVWTEEFGMLDLNNLLNETGIGWELVQANAINNAGQIVGYGINPDGVGHAFLLSPVPEPGS
jgi:probable HAF family extracellular repeat protein